MTPLDQFIQPARASLGWWRPILGLGLILGLWFVGTILVVMAWAAIQIGTGQDIETALASMMSLEDGEGSSIVTLVMLATFLGIWGGCWMATEIVHNQRFMTLFAPSGRVLSGAFLQGLGFAVGFSVLSTLAAIALVETPVQAQAPADWAVFLVPLVVLIFFQAVGEELIFRGYLLQQLAVRFRSIIVWGILPSLGFGILHYANAPLTETSLGVSFEVFDLTIGYAQLYYVGVTFITGLIFVALVVRTGNLWAAAGLHVGVNVFGLCGVGAQGLLSGTQLWLYSGESIGYLLEVDLIAASLALAFVLSPAGRVFAPSTKPR